MIQCHLYRAVLLVCIEQLESVVNDDEVQRVSGIVVNDAIAKLTSSSPINVLLSAITTAVEEDISNTVADQLHDECSRVITLLTDAVMFSSAVVLFLLKLAYKTALLHSQKLSTSSVVLSPFMNITLSNIRRYGTFVLISNNFDTVLWRRVLHTDIRSIFTKMISVGDLSSSAVIWTRHHVEIMPEIHTILESLPVTLVCNNNNK